MAGSENEHGPQTDDKWLEWMANGGKDKPPYDMDDEDSDSDELDPDFYAYIAKKWEEQDIVTYPKGTYPQHVGPTPMAEWPSDESAIDQWGDKQ